MYNIGQELKYIRDNETYQEAGYSGFRGYVEQELDYTRRQSYRFIKIAEEYSVTSMSQIGEVGITKLAELAKIENKKNRQKFIEENGRNKPDIPNKKLL